MKQIKYVAMIAAMAFASCQVQDELKSNFSQEMTFTAMSGEGETRTQIDGSNAGKVLWSQNDAIKVFYADKAAGTFTYKGTEAVDIATFTGGFTSVTGGIEVGTGSSEYYWAVYPNQNGSKYESESVTVTVPASQKATKGSFQNGAFPSIAKSQTPSLAFYNVCGGICFTVSRSDINEIVFEGKNNEDLVGTVKVVMKGGKPVVDAVVEGQKTVTLTGALEAGANYYVSLLPQTLSSGIVVTFSTTSGLKGSCEYDGTTIERSSFSILNNIDSKVNVWSKTVWVNDEAGSESIEAGAGTGTSTAEWISYSDNTVSWEANTTGKPREGVITLPNGGTYTVKQVEAKDLAGEYDFYNYSFKTTGVSSTTVVNQNGREHITAVRLEVVKSPEEINGHVHNLDLVGLYLDFKVPVSFEIVDGTPMIYTYMSLDYQTVSDETKMACIPEITYSTTYNNKNYNFAPKKFGANNCNYFWAGWGLENLFETTTIAIGSPSLRHVASGWYFCGFSFVKEGYSAYTTIYQLNYKNQWVYSEAGGAHFVRK